MSDDQRQQELGLHETGPVKRVEEYKFAPPILGYPMLQWTGKRPFTSTQYYPAQHKETYGPQVNGWRNKIYWGDNLQVMSHLLKEYRGQVKLVYIDPPFDSKADYKITIRTKGQEAKNDLSVFEEKQYSDIWTNDEYLQFMYERLIIIRELLSDTGSIFVHLDWHKAAYLKLILDEIFGEDNFVNEIIWHYSDNFQGNVKGFAINHNNIYWYSKTRNYVANKILIDLGKVVKRDKRIWSKEEQKLVSARDENGKLIYEDFSEKKADDVWEIGQSSTTKSASKEYIGYPTQKPEKLLERIVKAASNEGDLVLDCFMGSGTTQAVAMKLGRRFIGADINLGAVQITTRRLLEDALEYENKSHQLILGDRQPSIFYTGFDVYNVNNYDIFRNPVQAKELLIQALEVNPLPTGSLFDGEKDGRMVKIMPINRIATRQDLNELITGFDYRAFEKRQAEHPNQAVEKVTLVCMGHEPDLAAHLKHQMSPFRLDVEVVDILRDKQDLQFKRDSEAKIVIQDGYLMIEQFYPMNLLAKLSLQQEHVENWRELVDSVMVDWNYDGAVLQPAVIDVPEGNQLVAGRYRVPDDAGTIRVKITDLLSESLERELTHG